MADSPHLEARNAVEVALARLDARDHGGEGGSAVLGRHRVELCAQDVEQAVGGGLLRHRLGDVARRDSYNFV